MDGPSSSLIPERIKLTEFLFGALDSGFNSFFYRGAPFRSNFAVNKVRFLQSYFLPFGVGPEPWTERGYGVST